MPEIKVNDIQLTYDGETLTISSVNSPEQSVALDPTSVEELVDFIQRLVPPEEPQSEEANRRESFRVPVIDESGLRLTLIRDGNRSAATPTNISMTGVFAEFPADGLRHLAIDDEVRAEMAYKKLKIEVEAIVRRKETNGIGLFFPTSLKGEHVDPPPTIRRIVMDLQRRWMLHMKET